MPKKTKPKLLIVEDEPPMREALSEKFEREGFTVLTATDGKKGFDSALEERPDIIVLDIVLPKMNGMMVMRKLRQENAWGKTVPIVMLTNLNIDEKILKDLAMNEPSYYLVKSEWHLDDVVQKVRSCLEAT